jgi:protein TonB
MSKILSVDFVTTKIDVLSFIPVKKEQNWIKYTGSLLALGLHIVLFLNLSVKMQKTEKTVSPTPIAVSWISSTQEKKAMSSPKPEQKTVEKSQPEKIKTVTPTLKHQSKKSAQLIHSNQQAIAQTAISTQIELPHIEEKPVERASPNVTQSSVIDKDHKPSQATSETTQLDEPLVLPNLNASYLQNPAPLYPTLSRQNGEQGKVLVRVFVNEYGLVEKVTLKKSSSYERLDEVALQTVKSWRFIPAHRGEHPVSAWVVVPISFNLEG